VCKSGCRFDLWLTRRFFARDLADMRNDGRLTKDTFAVAMHLINGVLEGKDLPAALPTTSIPPSLRGSAGFAPFPVAAPTVSEAHRDLLSLDDDLSVLSPPQPVSPTRVVSPPAPVPVISQITASVLNPVAQTPPGN
jgi:epidermal growth factor receptor substrate 15